MNVRSLVVVVLLFLTVTGCRFFPSQPEPSSSTLTPTTTEEATIVPIGQVQRQVDIVEYGPGGVEYLSVLAERAELFPDDAVRVSGGGEALLNFGDALRLTLFNDSELGIGLEPAPDTPPIIQFYLFYGGFLGSKQPGEGGLVQVTTPAGAQITVTGTQFFVTYDPNSGETVAGNFDGSVELDMASGSISLSRGHYLTISASGGASAERPFVQTPEDFANAVRSMRSIHSAINALQVTPTPTSTGQPLPSPTPTATVAPAVPRAFYLLQANCRRGPDLAWEPLTVVAAETELPITGRTRDNSWYQVEYNGISCWSAASVMRVANGELAPIINVPPPPTATWTPTTPPTATPSPTPSPSATVTDTPSPTPTYETPTPSPTATGIIVDSIPPTPTPTTASKTPEPPIYLDVSYNCPAPSPVDIYWTDAASDEDGYVVYRYIWSDHLGDWLGPDVLTTDLPPDSTFFTDPSGYPERTLYAIGAYNKAGVAWAYVEKGEC